MLLALLSACDSTPCDALVAPPVAACFGGGDLEWPGYGSLEADVDGTVVSIGTGSRPDACLADVGNDQVHDGLVIVLEDADGLQYTVSLDVPDLSESVFAVGDPVHLEAAYTFGEFGPDVGRVSLADEMGTLRVLVEEAGEPEDLPEPSVTVAAGEPRCRADDGCGVYRKYDMDVTVGADTASVPYGEEAKLGSARVIHGGFDEQDPGQTGTCPDWFVASVVVAVADD